MPLPLSSREGRNPPLYAHRQNKSDIAARIDQPTRLQRTTRRPLYLATGIVLWLRRPWVIPVGLITGAMIFYAIVGFFLGDIFSNLPSVTNDISYWASNLPYLLYPLWLIPVLLFLRSLFLWKEPDPPRPAV